MTAQEELSLAIFHLAKAAAEYAALPSVTYHTGLVNPEFSGDLLDQMQGSAEIIARVLLAPKESAT